ncbi:replication protein, partial [Actinobacillus pleuropneumoniae]|uniref:replication protein n=2 Tax=Actinobacillus pleuropneumoniae TaxID=715 RepID=UPI003B019827
MSKFIPNSFQVPNAVVDEFLRKMSGPGIKCYLLITRQTTGWQKQKDRISINQFMEKCGIKDKRTAQNGVAELEELGLIIAFRQLGEITEFTLNFDFECDECEPVAKNVP